MQRDSHKCSADMDAYHDFETQEAAAGVLASR